MKKLIAGLAMVVLAPVLVSAAYSAAPETPEIVAATGFDVALELAPTTAAAPLCEICPHMDVYERSSYGAICYLEVEVLDGDAMGYYINGHVHWCEGSARSEE
jgi:hypothetical protein